MRPTPSRIFGKLQVQDIETAHIEKILRPIWNEKPETASRVRGRIEKVLDRAKALGLRSGENPARWTGHLERALPGQVPGCRPSSTIRPMPYAELPAFMAKLRAKDGVQRPCAGVHDSDCRPDRRHDRRDPERVKPGRAACGPSRRNA